MNQQLLLQVIAAIFALFALSRVYLRFRERKLSSFSFLFWVFIWVFGVMAVLIPELTTKIALMVGIGRGADVVLYASIVVIFYLIFRIYIKMEESQKEITEIARQVALRSELKKSPGKKPT